MAEAKLKPHKWTKADFEAAENYIAADKSDPFCRARVYTQMANGLAGYHWQEGSTTLIDARFSAKQGTETATVEATGEKYQRVTYSQRTRP